MMYLREILSERLSLEEIRTLCFDLGIDYDNLPGEGKTAKARELMHLDIYSRIVTDDPTRRTESFRTLQELYEALWRKQIENILPIDQIQPLVLLQYIGW
jgi:hypothetical protein